MFATPTSYCVTPTRPRPLMRLPERATTFLRDVKRRSLRVKRSKSMVISTPEKRKSDTFVKLDEDEVRKKYIDEINKNYQTKPGQTATLPQAPKEDIKDQIEFKPTTTGCHCECHGGLHPSTPLLQRSTPSFLPSPNSTISTIYTPRTSTATLDLDQSTKINITPHVAGDISTGHFRKLNSPSWQDQDNKENEQPSWQTPIAPLSPCLTRRSTRRSNLFTPKPKKLEATPSVKSKKPSDELGEGRMIPIKQGYLYKKSGSSRMYRRKYVTLCSDGSMTYYPSFQAYVDNVNGKEILLQYVTVKIPGKKPCGLKSSTTEKRQSGGSSCSSDEFDKETLLLTGCEKLEDKAEEPAETRNNTVQRKNSKRRRHRLSEDNEGSGSFELVIVSLDNRSWQFELCSQEEGEDWVSSIQTQIQRSLCGSLSTEREHVHASELEHIKSGVEGNGLCVDCGGKDTGWASLNLGVVMCIECSGIHRNHGSHVSRVRSLELDSWPPAHISVMAKLGNATANHVWEATMDKARKPQPEDSRQRKEQFFKAKYIDKLFLKPIPEGTSISDYLVKAVLESDMRSLCHALAHSTSSDVNSDNNQQRKSPLHVAVTQSNLAITQLLLWYKADVDETDKESRTMIDIACQLSGGNSQDICDLLRSSHANSSSPSAKVFHESKLL